MWEKKDLKAKVPDVKSGDNRTDSPMNSTATITPAPPPPSVNHPPSPPAVATQPTPVAVATAGKEEIVRIGRSIVIKGEISGAQDLVIEGTVEGKIDLRSNQVTIGQSGRINGEIMARHVIIHGQVNGNTYAEERLEIRTSGSLRGDIIAPRLIIEDGAYFKGSVEMEARKDTPASTYQTAKV